MQAALLGWLLRILLAGGALGGMWLWGWASKDVRCDTAALKADIAELERQLERERTAAAIGQHARLTLDNRIEIVATEARLRREAIRLDIAGVPECRLPDRVHAEVSEAAAAARRRLSEPANAPTR